MTRDYDVQLQDPHIALKVLDDPEASLHHLEVIAKLHPSMHAQVAAHPVADRALLAYIIKCGDPEATRIATERLQSGTVPPDAKPNPPRAKRSGWSLRQKLAAAALAIVLVVTGVASVRLFEAKQLVAVVVLLPQPPQPPQQPQPQPQSPAEPDAPQASNLSYVPCTDVQGPWVLSLCGSARDEMTAVAVTGDGVIIAGGTTLSVDGSFAGALAGFGSNGFVAVTRGPGDTSVSFTPGTVRDATTAPDGGVVMVGSSSINGPFAATVTKYDAQGNIVWTSDTAGTYGIQEFGGVSVGSNGEIVAWGTTDRSPDVFWRGQVVLAKFSPGGDLLWTMQYGSPGGQLDGAPAQVVVLDDGSIFMAGTTNWVLSKGDLDNAFAAMFDSHGNLKWSKNYGGSGAESFNSAIAASDGNILAVGTSNSMDGPFAANYGSVGVVAEISKKDGSLVSSWIYHYGDAFTEFDDIASTADGGYVLAGFASGSATDALVVRTSDLTSKKPGVRPDPVIWALQFGAPGEDLLHSVAVMPNNDIVAVGYASSTAPDAPGGVGKLQSVMAWLSGDGLIIQ